MGTDGSHLVPCLAYQSDAQEPPNRSSVASGESSQNCCPGETQFLSTFFFAVVLQNMTNFLFFCFMSKYEALYSNIYIY